MPITDRRSLSFPQLSLIFALLLGWPAFVQPAVAQEVPSTDIYLVPIEEVGDEVPELGEPRNLTRREGYDNQPSFLSDGSALVYTSIRHGQADIYRLDLESGESTAVTQTADTSEYSPTPIDGGKAISVVRVEPDGKQRLWSFPLDGEGEPSLLLPEVEPVGYHAWEGEKELVLFVLGEPNTLQRVALGGESRVMAGNIGRALHRIPGDEAAFSFVHKGDQEGDGTEAEAPEGSEGGSEKSSAWWLKRLDASSGEITPLIATLPGREDLCWDAEGRAWMADGSVLYRWCPACGKAWKKVADLAPHGLGEITRLAVSPDGESLALVASR